jgi:hypothetical protein
MGDKTGLGRGPAAEGPIFILRNNYILFMFAVVAAAAATVLVLCLFFTMEGLPPFCLSFSYPVALEYRYSITFANNGIAKNDLLPIHSLLTTRFHFPLYTFSANMLNILEHLYHQHTSDGAARVFICFFLLLA